MWRDGYARGNFLGHVYPDATAALHRWHESGHRLAVFSSGSVDAQKLLFGHSQDGDLAQLFSEFFDTHIGNKRESDSYRRIAEALHQQPCEIIFLSDVIEELDAAREAGMNTVLVDRLEDYPEPRREPIVGGHSRCESFEQINLESPEAG